MEPHDLHQMTVSQLRDLALERHILTDVHGMDKRQLLEALAPALGINLEALSRGSRGRLTADKSTLKREIRALKTQRDEALASDDPEAVATARHGIKLRKRKLRRQAKSGRTAAV